MESSHTLDVSRNGIRVQRSESCTSGSRVWVVFPFDAAAAGGVPPETPARLVHVESRDGGGYQISLQLELPSRVASRPTDRERRACSRISFALRSFVRVGNCATPTRSAPLSNPLAGMSAILTSVAVRWDAPRKA
jgi:hypothetical protein